MTLFRSGLVALAVAGAIAACSSGNDAPSGAPDPDAGGPTVDGGNCGRNSTPCVTGAACKGPQDCQAGDVCFGGVCTAPPATCTNGVKDNNETDVDCGGSCAPCADGKACAAPADCVDGVCNGTCQAPSCTDGIQNGAETGLDCGGACPTKCADGGGCKTGADCTSSACSPVNVCTPPSCTDGVKNGAETGLDCGGPCATKCPPGQGCAGDADCAAVRCDTVNLVCLPPTSTDGLQNGTETDVDCGGGAPTNAPKCAVGKGCALDGDCTVACNYASKCVSARSCKVQHGGDTCGPAGANESCCTSLPAAGLPGGSAPTTTIDKYNITAGRFRAFVTATGGDIKTWVANNTPAWWNAGWNAYLPSTLDDGSYGSPHAGSSLTEWMGPYLNGAVAGGNMGCEVKVNGARSYRLSDAINAGFGDEQDYTQDFDDERALNCVTAYIVAAFCAWDGGHMPTPQQIDHLWVNSSVPWGGAPAAGYSAANPADPMGAFGSAVYTNGATKAAPIPIADLLIANWNYNYWGGVPINKTDYTIYIAPPGRFPAGNGKYGHSDLGGSVFNLTTINGANVFWSRSGSWQGHAIPFTPAGTWANFPATNKYWATGGRCAR